MTSPAEREDKLALVRKFRDIFHRDGPAAAMRECGTEDFTWWALGQGDVTAQVDRILATMRSHIDEAGIHAAIVGTTVEGDRVALETELRATLKDGSIYHNRFHVLYQLRDGRIAAVREYFDTAHAAAVWERHFSDAPSQTASVAG